MSAVADCVSQTPRRGEQVGDRLAAQRRIERATRELDTRRIVAESFVDEVEHPALHLVAPSGPSGAH
ncbi:MAG: hypothetical protein IPK33_24000 [Gemmatimonadetes bacterium]|nr:hypothetical protein [Gemmatimonadota bacterium]